MKTIVVLLIVSCMAFVSSKEENFGLTYGRILGRHSVSAPAVNSQQQIRSFSYPDIAEKKDPIIGIKHINHVEPLANMTFIDGDINRKAVAIFLKSKMNHGIDSEFIFYGM